MGYPTSDSALVGLPILRLLSLLARLSAERSGARGGIRTPKPLRAAGPKPAVAADFTTRALYVSEEGLEPSRHCWRQALNLLRLPFRHPDRCVVAYPTYLFACDSWGK